MSKTWKVLLTIAASVVGLMAGGLLVLYGEGFVLSRMGPDSTTVGPGELIFVYALAFVFGAIPGAVIEGIIVHKLLRQRSLFSSGMQGVYSSGDTQKQQPVQAKCPFCHSTTFRVEKEAGSRTCSDCHSVLPKYIEGNR